VTLRRAYAPMLPEFDAYLFASIGEELDGMPLSVLSALSRLGLEPRDEAARLAHLTRDAAADQLARMSTRLSDRQWGQSEAQRIASGLIERLPIRNASEKADSRVRSAEPASGFRVPSFLSLALALAALVGLIAGGYLSFGS